MNEAIIETIRKDIERCKHQTERKGSAQLFQTLIAKYNSLFPGFANDIPENGKMAPVGSDLDYRQELNAVSEKLEMQLLIDAQTDPLYGFKSMYANDLARLEECINDNDGEIQERDRQSLYKEVTAKYYPYVPKLGEGLYEYVAELGFFEEVSGESLNHNIAQVYFKLKTYQSLGFPSLTKKINVGGPVINLTTRTENHNINENQNMLSVSFDDVRKKIEAMSALPEGDLEEIQSKIDELESIVKSKDTRNKKWSAAKEIIKWVADKGVDVGIAILPLLLNIN